jgi:opacity protein-like surface antigen
VQIGADVRLLGPGTTWQPGPFYFDVDGRIGLFQVSADTAFNLLPSTGGSFPAGASFSKNNSLIYELGATLGYQLTPNWDVHVGYRWLSIADALFAGDYAVAANAQSSQNIVPNTRRFNLQMGTIGTRVTFP